MKIRNLLLFFLLLQSVSGFCTGKKEINVEIRFINYDNSKMEFDIIVTNNLGRDLFLFEKPVSLSYRFENSSIFIEFNGKPFNIVYNPHKIHINQLTMLKNKESVEYRILFDNSIPRLSYGDEPIELRNYKAIDTLIINLDYWDFDKDLLLSKVQTLGEAHRLLEFSNSIDITIELPRVSKPVE